MLQAIYSTHGIVGISGIAEMLSSEPTIDDMRKNINYLGEMAQYLNRDINADLKISTMSAYKRSYYYDSYLKHFVPNFSIFPERSTAFLGQLEGALMMIYRYTALRLRPECHI